LAGVSQGASGFIAHGHPTDNQVGDLCAGYRKRIADLVVIVLGTNDLKQMFNRTPLRIAIGAAHLIDLVNTLNGGVGTTYKNPKVLLICPPLLNPEVGSSAGEA